MTKKTLLGSAFAIVGLCVWTAYAGTLAAKSPGAYAADEPDGKAVFLEHKCAVCHSALSAGIKPPADSKMKIIDLSGLAGKNRTPTWLKAYLKKTEKLEGRAHPTNFGGTPAELNALATWLMSLKPAP